MPERGHEAFGIAMSIGTMTGGALLMEDAAAQPNVRAVAHLRGSGHRHAVQIRGNIDPGLRFPQLGLGDDTMHGGAVALGAREIGQLPHDVFESLARQCRNRARRVALGFDSVAARTGFSKHRSATLRMRIQFERLLRGAVHLLFRCGRNGTLERDKRADHHRDAPTAHPCHWADHLDNGSIFRDPTSSNIPWSRIRDYAYSANVDARRRRPALVT